jgi:hypothetical protein
MKHEVTLKNTNFEQQVQSMQMIAKMAQTSGLYKGFDGEAKIFMILMAANELGIPPIQALNKGINIIQGNVELSARLMASMIRKAGHSIMSKECNANICILEGKRADNGDTFSAQFSVEDAQKAGLMGRPNWKNYTEDMLYARAMSRLARRLYPDVIGTAYVEGEIRGELEDKSSPSERQESQLQETEVEIIEPVDDKKVLRDFLAKVVPEGDQNEEQWATSYLEAYALHNKKTVTKTIEAYDDLEKFKQHCSTWKAKQIAKEKEQA